MRHPSPVPFIRECGPTLKVELNKAMELLHRGSIGLIRNCFLGAGLYLGAARVTSITLLANIDTPTIIVLLCPLGFLRE